MSDEAVEPAVAEVTQEPVVAPAAVPPEPEVTMKPAEASEPVVEIPPVVSVSDEEPNSVEGRSEVAASPDSIAIAEADEDDFDEVMPSYFVEEDDRHRVDVDILFEKRTGRITSVARTGLGIDYTEYANTRHVTDWFEFTIPDYDKMVTYRQRATEYRRETSSAIVDRMQLRNFYIVWHLKDWSLKDRKGNKVEITHAENGMLSAESIKSVYAIPSTIIDVVMTIFEKDFILN